MRSMYIGVEHKTWDEALPYVAFAYSTAVLETAQVTPVELVYGRRPTSMLDPMLGLVEDDDLYTDIQGYLQRAAEARQLARVRTADQQLVDAGRYGLRREDADNYAGVVCGFELSPARRNQKLLR